MPKEKRLFESFKWVVPFEVGNRKGKKVIIRGQALFPLVSKNLRRYIEEELVRSARTLANGYIDVNHEWSLWAATQEGHKPHLKGNVIDAEFEDGAIEYVGQVNHPEYFEKLLDGSKLTESQYFDKWGKKPIRHVSVDAIYRFHDAGEDWQGVEPHGIRFNGLSMVEDPEIPGVAGTTLEVVEIRETMNNPQVMLLQNYFKDIGVATEVLERNGKIVIEERKLKNVGNRTNPLIIRRVLEQEDADKKCPEGQRWDEESQSCVPIATEQQECPEGQKWDEEQGKCVPIATEQDEPCPEGQKRNDEGECVPIEAEATEQDGECPEGYKRNVEGECVPIEDEEATEQEEDERKCPEGEVWDDDKGECVPKEEIAKEFYKLGEPFADYKDFDDCVAKNQSKEDPEAYCADVKRKVEDEPLEQKQARELREFREKQRWDRFQKQFNAVKNRVKSLETVGRRLKKIERNIAKIVKKQDKILKESRKLDAGLQNKIIKIQKTTLKLTVDQKKTIKETQDTARVEVHALQESMTQLDDKIESLMVDDGELIEIRKMFKEYQEEAKTTLDGIKETLAKIPKLEEDFESLKTHIKPEFKAKPPDSLTETTPSSKPIPDPIKG